MLEMSREEFYITFKNAFANIMTHLRQWKSGESQKWTRQYKDEPNRNCRT